MHMLQLYALKSISTMVFPSKLEMCPILLHNHLLGIKEQKRYLFPLRAQSISKSKAKW